jgi:hypothetical protein
MKFIHDSISSESCAAIGYVLLAVTISRQCSFPCTLSLSIFTLEPSKGIVPCSCCFDYEAKSRKNRKNGKDGNFGLELHGGKRCDYIVLDLDSNAACFLVGQTIVFSNCG